MLNWVWRPQTIRGKHCVVAQIPKQVAQNIKNGKKHHNFNCYDQLIDNSLQKNLGQAGLKIAEL